MRNKLSVFALVVVVATALFVAGTMFASATAANTAAGERIYVGAVAKDGNVFIVWVEDRGVYGPKYVYEKADRAY